MAYKYQSLAATMSGSLTQEGDFTVKTDAGATSFSATQAGAVSGSSHLSAGGNLTIAGTVKLSGVADAAIANADDSLYFKDSDGLMKSEAVSDFVSGIAGPGLAEVGGALELDIDEFSALGGATIAQGDNFLLSDAGTEKKVTFSNLEDSIFASMDAASSDVAVAAGGAVTLANNSVGVAEVSTAVAGDGLTGGGGSALAVQASGSVHISSDKVSISGSIAGAGLTFLGGVDSINGLALDIDTLSALGGTGIAQSDKLLFSDAGSEKTITFSNFEDAIFANVSSQATVAAGGALSLAAAAITGQTEMTGDVEDADELMISDGGTLKRLDFSVLRDAVFNDVSGDATVAAGGALTVANDAIESGMLNDNIISGQTELAHADIADADEMMISDGGVIKRVGVDSLRDHYFGVVSGDATIADGGALTIAANAVEDSMVNDNVATGLAGVGLSAASGVMALDLNELTEETLASGDFFAFVDSTDNGTHKETVDDLATLFAGTGLAASSAVLSIDLNELGAAAVDVTADSIAIIDATDNTTKKESIADLVSGMAGAGLTDTNGVLSVTGNNVALKADGNALVEGYNYFADASSNATVTMPAAPAVGDVVTVKAGNLTSGATIIINKGSADHRIDGLEGIIIESPFGAVTMVYVVADHWKIV